VNRVAFRFAALFLATLALSVGGNVAPAAPPATAESLPRVGTTAGDRMEIALSGDVKLAFRWCPPGTFKMGNELGTADVLLTKGFWMAETEVSQAQWRAVMGADPENLAFRGDPKNPVERVSWNDIMGEQTSGNPIPRPGSFLAKLNEQAGLSFTLPTEAQWEYACRAGTTTPFHFGATIKQTQVNHHGGYPHGKGAKGLYREKTIRVGSLPANPWGLHEMHGNVSEWCADWFGDSLPGGTDPTGPSAGSLRVYRGGGWGNSADACGSAYRNRDEPSLRDSFVGFRVVLGGE
jgi:formylglycine-generating enzyme required for sulfatase activity